MLSEFTRIPYPSKVFENVKVIFPFHTSRRVVKDGNEKILYQLKNYKISKVEISIEPDKYVMIVIPSMQVDLQRIPRSMAVILYTHSVKDIC
jgi:hypothetical protein